MNPDEQNANLGAGANVNPAVDLGGNGVGTPGVAGAAPAVDVNVMGGAVPGVEPLAAPAAVGADPVVMTEPAVAAPMAADPVAPAAVDPVAAPVTEPAGGLDADPLVGLGGGAAPTDTTFTPVTAGEEVPAPAPIAAGAPAGMPEAAAPAGSVDMTAAAVPVAADAVANPAGVAGSPVTGEGVAAGKKLKLNSTMIILIAVAGVAVIGVVVLLVLTNIK